MEDRGPPWYPQAGKVENLDQQKAVKKVDQWDRKDEDKLYSPWN